MPSKTVSGRHATDAPMESLALTAPSSAAREVSEARPEWLYHRRIRLDRQRGCHSLQVSGKWLPVTMCRCRDAPWVVTLAPSENRAQRAHFSVAHRSRPDREILALAKEARVRMDQ